MEVLLEKVWLNAGALGLLTISGWAMWWFEHRERVSLTKERLDIFREMLALSSELKTTMDRILELVKEKK